MILRDSMYHFYMMTDECEINNGECGLNAACSHDPKTNAVVCTCQTGYTNIGTAPDVICAGNKINPEFSRLLHVCFFSSF